MPVDKKKISGDLEADNLVSTGDIDSAGDVQGDTLTSDSTIDAVGDIQGGTLTSDGDIDAAGDTQSDTFTVDSYLTLAPQSSEPSHSDGRIIFASGAGSLAEGFWGSKAAAWVELDGAGGGTPGPSVSDEIHQIGGEDNVFATKTAGDKIDLSGGTTAVSKSPIVAGLATAKRNFAGGSDSTVGICFAGILAGGTANDQIQTYNYLSETSVNETTVMPAPLRDLSAGSDGTTAWTFGGGNTGFGTSFDVISKTLISTIGSVAPVNVTAVLTTDSARHSVGVLGTDMFVLSGRKLGSGVYLRDVDEFDTTGDSGNGTITSHLNVLAVATGKMDGTTMVDTTNSQQVSAGGQDVGGEIATLKVITMSSTPTEVIIATTIRGVAQLGDGGFNATIGVHTGGFQGAANLDLMDSFTMDGVYTRTNETAVLGVATDGQTGLQVNR